MVPGLRGRWGAGSLGPHVTSSEALSLSGINQDFSDFSRTTQIGEENQFQTLPKLSGSPISQTEPRVVLPQGHVAFVSKPGHLPVLMADFGPTRPSSDHDENVKSLSSHLLSPPPLPERPHVPSMVILLQKGAHADLGT